MHIRSAAVLGCCSFAPADSSDAILPPKYPHLNGRRRIPDRFLTTSSQLNSRSAVSNVQQQRSQFQRRSDNVASGAADPQPSPVKIPFLRHFERSRFARQYGVRFAAN